MFLKNEFPYVLAACMLLSIFPLTGAAQSGETRQREISQSTRSLNLSPLDNDPVIISLASAEEIEASKPLITKNPQNQQFHHLISAAIDQRLGARYRWGATGPSAFDCSGFVWSTFQSVGIDFERSSARALWARFAAPALGEEYKFGTLVFFRNLAHVGIVADEHGFYHASRQHGVVYSPFNEYWLSRLDGFRKVPMVAPTTAD